MTDNEDRANVALHAGIEELEQRIEDALETALVEHITNILHQAAYHHLDTKAILRMSELNYEAEVQEQEEENIK